ncbi:MAG TPA: ABC transporter permease [Microscillaceae bacterium]|nr:ABC transporter permease [Microscillaceae bacterium]
MARFFDFVSTRYADILSQTLEHIYLTLVSLFIATALGLFLGIYLSRKRKAAGGILGILGVIQTIPSIAMLGLLIPLVGIGAIPAIIALFLYALLPIVRNTFTGITEVEDAVIEAAKGMGMTSRQILLKVELPLAVPIIFAGIRTAMVINVGVATLGALINAGGLGKFIFRGISLYDPVRMMAGAIPAALLALLLDFLLGQIQKIIHRKSSYVGVFAGVITLFLVVYMAISLNNQSKLIGSNPEFVERLDGYQQLAQAYQFTNLKVADMEAGLMYYSLASKRVDAVVGYSTDGRIEAYKLKILKDDKNYFPPYYVAPMIRQSTALKHPELMQIFEKLAGKISEAEMVFLNYLVDDKKMQPRQVALDFMKKKGFKTTKYYTGSQGEISIGGKKFTEHFILAEIFKILIENNSNLKVNLKTGLGGTQIAFEALKSGEIDLYPEYTGTALFVMLKTSAQQLKTLGNDRQRVYDYVKVEMKKRFDMLWLSPLGFNNTYAILMRKKQAEQLGIQTVSDFSRYLRQAKQ